MVKEKDRIDRQLDQGRWGGETFSTLSDYAEAFGFKINQFCQLLDNQTVLDLGSGAGGLAISCTHAKIKGRVFSVNPRLAQEYRGTRLTEIRKYVEATTNLPSLRNRLARRIRGRPYNRKTEIDEQTMATVNTHDRFATAAWTDSLPFPNNSFNLVFDNDAASAHVTPSPEDCPDPTQEEKELFENSIKEMLRVTKTGGKIYIGDIYGYNGGSEENWREAILRGLKVNYTKIPRKIDPHNRLFHDTFGNRPALGIIIDKE